MTTVGSRAKSCLRNYPVNFISLFSSVLRELLAKCMDWDQFEFLCGIGLTRINKSVIRFICLREMFNMFKLFEQSITVD